MLNQIIIRSRLGKSYRVHSSESGVLPKGLKPLSFCDRSSAKQFLETLSVGLDFWQPILRKHGTGTAYGYKNQSLEKVAEYLVQKRFQIIEVPDENRLAASVQKRSIKLPSGELIQFFAASEMLTKKGAQKKQFANQNAAKEFVQKNTQSAEQLQQVLTAADIPFAPSDSEEILSDKVAEAVLQEKLFISTSKPIARPPEPKDSAPPAAGPRPVELAPPPPRTWIEVVLKDDKGEPISGEDYWILDPEGNEHTGKTDGAGMARVDGILSGYCQVAFPNIDGAGIHQCAAGVDCCTPAEEASSPPVAEPANQAEEENTEEEPPEEEAKPESENQSEIGTTDEAESPVVEEQTYKVDLEMTEANGRGAKKTPYKAKLADGSTREGELDDDGKATIENIPNGAVEVEFGEEVVEQEIIDLRNQIKSVLHDVVESEKKETAEIEAKLAEMNVVAEWWEYKKAELRGYYNFTVGVLTFAKDVMDFSPLHQAERAIASAWDAWMSSDEQPFLDAFAQKFTDAQMKELVDLIGVDPRTISKEDIAQVWAIANLIWDDADTRKILMDFAWNYIKAQHPLEMTESGAEVALEIAFDVLITALTAGVGATVVAASKLKHLSKLRKIGSVLKELADKLRKKALRKKTSGSAGGKVSAGADKPPVFDKTPNNASPKPEKPKKKDSLSPSSKGVKFDDFKDSVDDFELRPELAEEAFELFKAEDWGALEKYFQKHDLNGGWPPNRGAIASTPSTLVKGQKIDRYGGWFEEESGKFRDKGTFVANYREPFPNRALPDTTKTKPYRSYEVVKDIPNVESGEAIPWFGQPGKGVQHELPMGIEELVNKGYLREIQ